MPLRNDFADATSSASVHAQHHNDLAKATVESALQGDWSASLTYTPGRLVYHKGLTWVCTVATTAGTEPGVVVAATSRGGIVPGPSGLTTLAGSPASQEFQVTAAMTLTAFDLDGQIVSGRQFALATGSRSTPTSLSAAVTDSSGTGLTPLSVPTVLQPNTTYYLLTPAGNLDVDVAAGTTIATNGEVTAVGLGYWYGTTYETQRLERWVNFELIGSPVASWVRLTPARNLADALKGVYGAAVSYERGDVVRSGSSSWVALNDGVLATPSTSSTDWSLLAGTGT